MPISFAADIAVLFTDGDVACMEGQVELRDYAFMSDPADDAKFPDHAHARHVLGRVSLPGGILRMPRGKPAWSPERIALFARWMEDGYLP